jgi:hypothetical protein
VKRFDPVLSGRCSFFFILWIGTYVSANSQQLDSTSVSRFFRGQVTVTNNGISLIPSFSLGRPAALFDLSLGKGRLSFDPMLRFGLDGKPWAFVFWWRYKLIQNKKWNWTVGAHPSLVFRDVSITANGKPANYLTTQRYFAWELAPSVHLSPKFNLGVYYLGALGLTDDLVQQTSFLAIRLSMHDIPLGKALLVGVIPQVFYLKMDANDGYYSNLTGNLFIRNFPLSLNLIVSQAIETSIGGNRFLWSIGLVYNINNEYIKIHPLGS